MSSDGGAAATQRQRVLLASVVVVATSGMIYELVAGTLAAYFLGNAVTQFSIVLGVYLSAMGVGASASARLGGRLTARFVEVETAVALLGGSSAALLFFAFARATSVGYFRVVLYGDVFVIGTLVGIELPLLMRLLKEDLGFDESVVRGLTFDYVGSLVASVLFPLVLVPWLGLVRTAALSGIVNALVAWAGARLLLPGKGRWARQVGSLAVAAALAMVIVYSRAIVQATAD